MKKRLNGKGSELRRAIGFMGTEGSESFTAKRQFLDFEKEPLIQTLPLNYPIGLLPLLTYHIDNIFKQQFTYLKNHNRFAKKVYIHLHCLYDHYYHLIEVTPGSSITTKEDLLDEIERKLLQVDLANPVIEIEVETVPSLFTRPRRLAKTKAILSSGIYTLEQEF